MNLPSNPNQARNVAVGAAAAFFLGIAAIKGLTTPAPYNSDQSPFSPGVTFAPSAPNTDNPGEPSDDSHMLAPTPTPIGEPTAPGTGVTPKHHPKAPNTANPGEPISDANMLAP